MCVATDVTSAYAVLGVMGPESRALLETLMAFVIADASPNVIRNIGRFHDRRTELGIYQESRDD